MDQFAKAKMIHNEKNWVYRSKITDPDATYRLKPIQICFFIAKKEKHFLKLSKI